MSMKRRTLLAGPAVLAIAVCTLLSAQVTRIPVTPEEKDSDQSKDTQIIMQAKLVNAQKVLEGLVTQDFQQIEAAAAVLGKISLTPPPGFADPEDSTDAQVYDHFRMEFARLAGQLERHARRSELEATAYVQQNLTASCIACHDYIRDYE